MALLNDERCTKTAEGSLALWPADHPALGRFKARRCSTLAEVRARVQDELARTSTNAHGQIQTRNTQDTGRCPSVSVSGRQRRSFASAELAANGALSLLNLCCYLLERQIEAQAAAFEQEGGFTERLFRIRSERRRKT